MARDAKRDLTWSLTGVGVGVGALALTIEGPDGLKLERDWEIAVRPAQAVTTRQITSRIQAGQRSTLTASIMGILCEADRSILRTPSRSCTAPKRADTEQARRRPLRDLEPERGHPWSEIPF